MSAYKLLEYKFKSFINNTIDLNINDVEKACKSRDNLINNIIEILNKNIKNIKLKTRVILGFQKSVIAMTKQPLHKIKGVIIEVTKSPNFL